VKTTEDLKAAFAGESQANRKYLAWAAQAEREGLPEVAKLFRAVAAAETVHAHMHFRTLGEIKTTADNLKAAIQGENYEVVTMYPDFLGDAAEEDHKAATRSFEWAWEVEKIHEQLYIRALSQLENGGVPDATYWVCQTCGHTHLGDEAPERCPVCNAKRTSYIQID
jgi:rubrerythrin